MDQVKDSHVLVDINKGTMHLSLNRPESLNAFSPDMIASLKDALNKAKGDEDIRVVTISGSGRSFSAGGDVKTEGKREPLDVYEHIGELNELIHLMRDLEKPIIADVHGYAAGAGINLAIACDINLAADKRRS